MKRSASLILAIALGGCGQGDRANVEEVVRGTMKDPESASFGDFTEQMGANGTYACIGVNGRNSFGGYTGEQQAALLKGEVNNAEVWAVVDFYEIDHSECVRRIGIIAGGNG